MTIPSEQEIKDVVEWIKIIREKQDFLVHIDDTQPLLDLAKAYLECSVEMPKKKECDHPCEKCDGDECRVFISNESCNQAIDDCTFALLKEKSEFENKMQGLTPELLHEWYLKATSELKKESYNPNAQKPYNELTEEQKIIDKFIADSIRGYLMGEGE